MSSEERKRMQEVTEWLNSGQGYLWARREFKPVDYGRPSNHMEAESHCGLGLFQLKHTDERDVSGTEDDFTALMWWGNLPGDGELYEEFLRNGETEVVSAPWES